MKILTKSGYIDSVALFFELSDEQLNKIQTDKDYYMSREKLEEFNVSKGDNAYFFGISNTKEQLRIQDYIKDVLKEYKSVSWWDKDMKTFNIVRK